MQVLTRAEINAMESRYWLQLTSVGQFLLVAVVLAVVVGVIFVYQMMAADIRNMLPEYATVKALGYRPPYLTGVVLWQAVLLAMLGYVPGFLAAIGLYAAARKWGGIPTDMTLGIAIGVLILTWECVWRRDCLRCVRSIPLTRPTCSSRRQETGAEEQESGARRQQKHPARARAVASTFLISPDSRLPTLTPTSRLPTHA